MQPLAFVDLETTGGSATDHWKMLKNNNNKQFLLY